MTFYAFRLLSPVVQLYWMLKHGTYLAQRLQATLARRDILFTG